MNCAIFGTLNSILREGWSDSIKNVGVKYQFSVGGSCSGAGVYSQILSSINNKCDVNYIDFFVNDNQHLNKNVIDIKHMKLYMYAIYKNILSSGNQAQMIIFPVKNLMSSYNDNTIYKLYYEISEKLGIPLFDGFKFVELITREEKYSINDLFMDNLHLERQVASFFGNAITSSLSITNKFYHAEQQKSKFYTINTQDFKEGRIYKNMESSLRKEEVVILQKEEILKIETKDYLCGLFIDTNNSKVKIKIKIDDEVIIKNIYTSPRNARDGVVQFKYIPLFDMKKIKAHFELSIASVNDPVTEKTLDSREELPTDGVLYLCGFLLTKDTVGNFKHIELKEKNFNKRLNKQIIDLKFKEQVSLLNHTLNPYLLKIEKALKVQDYITAENIAKEGIKKFPKDIYIMEQYAVILLQLGKEDEADKQYEKIILSKTENERLLKKSYQQRAKILKKKELSSKENNKVADDIETFSDLLHINKSFVKNELIDVIYKEFDLLSLNKPIDEISLLRNINIAIEYKLVDNLFIEKIDSLYINIQNFNFKSKIRSLRNKILMIEEVKKEKARILKNFKDRNIQGIPHVAVCISGQLRGYLDAKESLFSKIIEPLQADIFVHTWRDTGVKLTVTSKEHAKRLVTKNILEFWFNHHGEEREEIEKYLMGLLLNKSSSTSLRGLKKHYEGCVSIIEEDLDIEEITQNIDMKQNLINLRRMYYKIYHCDKLRQYTESELNVEYDYVIRIRPDVNYIKGLTVNELENMIEDNEIGIETIDNQKRILSDQFAIANSKTMTIYSELYKFIDEYTQLPYIRSGSPHAMLYDHLFLRGQSVKKTPRFRGKYLNLNLTDEEVLNSLKLASLNSDIKEEFRKYLMKNDLKKSINLVTNNKDENKSMQSDSKVKTIEKIIKFEEDLWLFKNKINCQNLRFSKSSLQMDIDLSSVENALYIDSLPLKTEEEKEFELNVEAEFSHTRISCYVVELKNSKEKVSSKSYKVVKGKNKFNHTLHSKTESIKILFRFDNNKKDTVILENLELIRLTDDVTDELKEYIKNIKNIKEKLYLMTVARSYYSDSYTFRPRKDNKEYEIDLPMDWDVNPFNENNWMFHLHALRLLDREMSEYISTKDIKKLERMIEVILDWKRDVVDNKKNFDFNRETSDSSLAWHDMATGLRAMKIAFVFEEIIKLEEINFQKKYIKDIYVLVRLHIQALSNQKIAPNNHAIYQLHGLMMLLRLFPSNFEDSMDVIKQNTEKNMLNVFYGQFFKEGIHKENSERYHLLAIETFEKILAEEIYPDILDIFNVIRKAKKNCAYMHFPNFESLMTGDSDYKILKPGKEEEIKEGIIYFKESGYTYIYEVNDNPSMLFFDTAFLNRTHRHADFFNVLLYEYGKNILVDAGKYSYVKTNPFRQYCISTRAHNVVLIDNEDYKLDRKYFFTSNLVIKDKKENYYHLMASNYYDSSKVSHDRHIFYKPQEFFFVVDILRSKESKNFKQIFHLHQDLELKDKGKFLKSKITDDIVMNIKMKSLEMNENKIQSNISFSKGLDGEIEGYRALGHNEIVENYVLVNELESTHIVLGSMFSFNKKRDFDLVSRGENRLEIIFDSYQEMIEG